MLELHNLAIAYRSATIKMSRTRKDWVGYRYLNRVINQTPWPVSLETAHAMTADAKVYAYAQGVWPEWDFTHSPNVKQWGEA